MNNDDLTPEVKDTVDAKLGEMRIKGTEISLRSLRKDNHEVEVSPSIAGVQRQSATFADDTELAANICRFLDSVKA